MPQCGAAHWMEGEMHPEWWFVAAPALCAGILMPAAIGARSIGHDHADGVQAMHVAPTSRLGGAIVYLAFAAAVLIACYLGHDDLAPTLALALAALPVVVVGLWEDVTRRVRPRYRLLAALASAMLASFYAGTVVPRVDLPLVDYLLGFAWFALPLTWFMVVGSCNAFNLIDGTHGLASGTALILFGGLALAAGWSQDGEALATSLAMMGAIAGFLVWNYPHGKVFLGDAGAYFIGFMYAQLSIRLISHNDEFSAWYVIVLAGYPIVDTLFAMYRRGMVRHRPLMSPDALHLHSLVFRRIAIPRERRRLDRRVRDLGPPGEERRHGDRRAGDPSHRRLHLHRANRRVAPRLWVHSVACLAMAIVFYDNTYALLACLAVYTLFYTSRYRALVRFGRRHVRRVLAAQGDGREQ